MELKNRFIDACGSPFVLGIFAGAVPVGATSLILAEKTFVNDMERWEKHILKDNEEMEILFDEYLAREAALKDQFTPCTKEQAAEIDEVQAWVIANFQQINDNFAVVCKKMQDSCELNPHEVNVVMRQMLHEIVRTQVFCPSEDEERRDASGTLGTNLRDADEARAGQIAIYPLAFEDGTCRVAGTYIHELGHAATLAVHDDDTTVSEDWVYLLGYVVLAHWDLDHEGEYCEPLSDY